MTTLTRSALRALLDDHGLRPSRGLGQHFLADPNTARRIANLADIRAGDRVLEIGAGAGSLTVALLEAGARVTALELDRHVLAVLRDVVSRTGMPERVHVVEGDALDVDLDALLGNEGHAVVANLPYNVAVPIVMRLLDDAPAVDRILVMVQREVGERLAAPPGGKEYGAVSVHVAYHATARRVGLVPAAVFLPPPRVESALVELRRHERPPVDVPSHDRFVALVRAGFGQRRKMARRSLRAELGSATDATLVAAGIDPSARAETLTLAEWGSLARVVGGGDG